MPSNRPDDRFGTPETFEDPYNYYRELRRAAPVFYSDRLKAFVVSRTADARYVLDKPDIFRSAPATNQSDAMARHSTEFQYLYEEAGTPTPMATLVAIDGTEHTRYRALVAPFFGPAAVRNLEGSLTAIVNELLDGIRGNTPVDFYREFCLRVPLFVICDLLGIPRDAEPIMKSAADSAMELVGAAILSHEQKIEAHRRLIRLNLHLQPFIDAARKSPKKDLIGHLVTAEAGGRTLNDREVIAFIQTLNLGGNETTTNGLGNMIHRMMITPGMEDRLRGNRALIPKFVEEAIRLESPINACHRWARSDTEIAGVQIPGNACVYVCLPAVNHDEARFEDPDAVNLDRPAIRDHLAYGTGIHFCLGAALARTEMRIAMSIILDRMENLRLDESALPLRHHRMTQIRGVTSLPILFKSRDGGLAKARQ